MNFIADSERSFQTLPKKLRKTLLRKPRTVGEFKDLIRKTNDQANMAISLIPNKNESGLFIDININGVRKAWFAVEAPLPYQKTEEYPDSGHYWRDYRNIKHFLEILERDGVIEKAF